MDKVGGFHMKAKKWSLLLKTLPAVGVVLGIRLVLNHMMGFEGLIEFSDVGMVFTGAIFLVGFMMSGVMSDYKESEKIPGELACSLEAVGSNFIGARDGKNVRNMDGAIQSVGELGRSVIDWLHGKKKQTEIFDLIRSLETAAVAADKNGAGFYAERAIAELVNIRKIVTRMGVISRTNFLPIGYALMELLVGATITLLFLAQFKTQLVEWLMLSFVSLICFNLMYLIKDIDDPFEYPNGKEGGSADIALFPIKEFVERFEAQMGKTNSSNNSKAA